MSQDPLMNHNYCSEDEQRVLQKIEDLLIKPGVDEITFTPEEQKIIRQMIQVYQTLMSFGRLGLWVKNLIIGAAAFLAAWLIVYTWAIGSLKSVLGLE